MEDGEWTETEEGTPQGATVSPLLANIYLHYVFDLWAHQWRRRHARGDVVIVRFADDFVVGFQHREDAERFLAELREQIREVRPGAARREDAADRVWAVRRPAARAAGSRQAGDVRLPGLHAHLREDQERTLRAAARHDLEADAGEAARGQGRAAATAGISPSPSRGSGWAAWCEGTAVLRRARQHQGGGRVPQTGGPALAPGASAPQPAHRADVGANAAVSQTLDPAGQDHASLAQRALRRQDPRQEPSAVAAHAGICAGGGASPHKRRAVPTATARHGHPEVLRQRPVGPHAESGGPPHRAALGAAVCGAVAESAAAAGGRQPGRAGSRNPSGFGDLAVVGEHVHALRVRRVDGPGAIRVSGSNGMR